MSFHSADGGVQYIFVERKFDFTLHKMKLEA